MKEIIRKFRDHPQTIGDAGLQVSYDNPDAYGLHFTSGTQIRIFVFETTGSLFYIDFIEQVLYPDKIYIVPPLHFYYLEAQKSVPFICIDIDSRYLDLYHRQVLYAIKYQQQKGFYALPATEKEQAAFSKIMLQVHALREQALTTLIEQWLEQAIQINMPGAFLERSLRYMETADAFLDLLKQKQLTLNTCKINEIAAELCCTERTLHRICKAVFGLCAKELLHYHLVTKAIYLLTRKGNSITDVAFMLNFSGVAVFYRYMLRQTGHTPSQIKEASSRISLFK